MAEGICRGFRRRKGPARMQIHPNSRGLAVHWKLDLQESAQKSDVVQDRDVLSDAEEELSFRLQHFRRGLQGARDARGYLAPAFRRLGLPHKARQQMVCPNRAFLDYPDVTLGRTVE